MNVRLDSLFDRLRQQPDDRWRALAVSLARQCSSPELVWARFAVWILDTVEPLVDTQHLEALASVRIFYWRVISGNELAPADWVTRAVDMLESVSFPHYSGFRTEGTRTQAAAHQALQQVGLVAIQAQGQRGRYAAARAGEYIDALGENARGRLLLYLQLAQPPRDPTEAGLQTCVLKSESTLGIYCDYLEEQGDPVAGWLREIAQAAEH